jgi:hypothetical protein
MASLRGPSVRRNPVPRSAPQTTAVAPAAINALKEALSTAYWYKSDLRSFLTNSLSDPQLLARLNWDDYKRNIVGSLVDDLAQNQPRTQAELLRLMTEVARIDDFSHLERLEDGREKSERAEHAVVALRKLLEPHEELLAEQRASAARRKVAYEESLKSRAVRKQLDALRTEFIEIIGPQEPQARGYRLEQLMKELFELFDLDPKASFRTTGEQIDGAFTFDNTDYLFEAKWVDKPTGLQDLDAFNGRISRKLENTLGLFLSINGFSPNAVTAHSSLRPSMILMDGGDLMAVLEGRIDLIDLLLRKRRHASQTGNIFLPVWRVSPDGSPAVATEESPSTRVS